MSLTSAKKLLLCGDAVTDPDARALIKRMSQRPTPLQRRAIQTLILRCKASGLWSKFRGFFVFHANSLDDAMLNWKPEGATVVIRPSSFSQRYGIYVSGNGGGEFLALVANVRQLSWMTRRMRRNNDIADDRVESVYAEASLDSGDSGSTQISAFDRQLFVAGTNTPRSGAAAYTLWRARNDGSPRSDYVNPLLEIPVFYTLTRNAGMDRFALYGNGNTFLDQPLANQLTGDRIGLRDVTTATTYDARFAGAGDPLTLSEHNALRSHLNTFFSEF